MSKSSSIDTSIEMPISARRTESLDAPDILKLVSSDTGKMFGRVNIAHMIEKSSLAVTLVDENNSIVGHAAFYDFPNWNVGKGDHWMSWMKSNFLSENNDPINTLFLHYYVSKEMFSEGIISEILRTVFYAVPLLHFIILLVPSDIEIGTTLGKVFEPMNKTSTFDAKYNGYICHRHNHCPVLYVREARIEDHDDLMPIFEKHTKSLTEIYGDYFLAELIEAQDESNKCIVADVDGTAVGFMSISTKINTAILKENFELDVFNHFIKKVERKIVVEPERIESKEECNPDGTVSVAPSSEGILSPDTLPSESPSMKVLSPVKSRMSKMSLKSTSDSPTPLKKKEDKKEKEVEYRTEEFDIESVFCIQLFIIDEQYEARSIDFLPAIFDLFKDKDFVIMTVPHNVPVFPLLYVFQRISPKYTSMLPQELYSFHRHGLLKSFNVRPCRMGHTNLISNLVEDIRGKECIMEDVRMYNEYRQDKDGIQLYVFVAEVLGQVVGVCILRDEKNIDYIRSHYNIEDFVYFQLHETKEHAHLYHLVLNPTFQQYSKYFLKEVLYLSKKTCLYYPIYPDSSMQVGKNYSLVTCLSDLVAISARRQIIYPLDDLEDNKPINEVIANKEPYALYHINRKLTLEPKVVINIRIVVVGASDVGIAALQTLAFCPHICFNNLTLVSDVDIFNSPTGFDDVRNSFMPQSLNYNSTQQALISLSTWVNFVNGKMTKIDRKNRYLVINGSQKIPFDQLLLCTGRQFHTSAPTGANINNLTTTFEALETIGGYVKQVHHGFTPNNIFTINSAKDCLQATNWVQNSMDTDLVIVYGSTLEAYTCINGLLSSGVPGTCIHHVHPPFTAPSCFNDPYIEQTIEEVLEREGVHTYHGYTLAQWNSGEKDLELKVATFTSDNKPLTLECEAFFCFQNKSINYNAFKAINDSCLIFDGKLVIDSKFHSNDSDIHAAGPLTKYALRYYTDQWSHANYNSKEIGTKLAESLLELFDPTLNNVEINSDDENLVPKYKKAKSLLCKLPGGYNFFQMWKPCIPTTLESLKNDPDYGQDLITGNLPDNKEKGYFRLHLNEFKAVQDVTCLTKNTIDVSNLLFLYGMHERYLNNMLQRHDEGLIDDLYSYFRQSWCLGIFHDRFRDFRSEVREILDSSSKPDHASLEERVRRVILEDGIPLAEQKSKLKDVFMGDDESYKKTIEERLNCFLNYNKYHLPMYARPHML